MKIITVIGARPQFIKAAAVSRELRKEYEEILIHTGQHYDVAMSDIFFNELHIPKPDYNLAVGSGSHAKQTGNMLLKIEEVLMEEKPDYLMVYGDTNSTIAGALAASKILIPVVHVEAGLRSYNKVMPEEQNRILTDHLSTLLFCPTETAVENLKKEGLTEGVFQIGDVMCDAVMFYAKEIEKHSAEYYFSHLYGIFKQEVKKLPNWYLATIHRAENTDHMYKLKEILDALEELEAGVIFPVHPRTKPLIKHLINDKEYKNIIFTEPIGYLDMLYFTRNALKVITDSGGLQKEAYLLETDTVTIRDQTEWVETLIDNFNILSKADKKDILEKVHVKSMGQKRPKVYGNGNSAKIICQILSEVS